MRFNTRQLTGGVLALAALTATTAGAISGDPIRVSLDNGGGQSPLASRLSAVSGDGTKVAFLSRAQLASEPTGGHEQLYVRDTKSGATSLVSASAMGAAANANVEGGTASNVYFDISADGRYVVFGTGADNLVPGDGNGKQDVFRKDLQTGNIELISTLTDCGGPGPCTNTTGDGDSRDPSVNAAGSLVAYETDASNLAYQPNGATSVLIVPAGGRSHFPQRPASLVPNGPTTSPSISASGNEVAFVAGPATTNLRVGDSNSTSDVYIGARFGTDLEYAGPGSAPDLNGSGKIVAFLSGSALVRDDGNGVTDAYKYNAVTNTTQLISTRDGQLVAGDEVARVAIGADGVRAVFESTGEILTRRLDGAAVASLGTGSGAAISGNGGTIAFTSPAAHDPSDTNAVTDVYTREFGATDTTAPTAKDVLYECGYKGSGGPAVFWNDDPSGIDPTHGYLYGGVGSQVRISATDGAGNAIDLTKTVTGYFGSGCNYDYEEYDHDPQDPVKSIKILSVKLVKHGVRVTYRALGGRDTVGGSFRLQRLRIGHGGRTLGSHFATSSREVRISGGTNTVTLPRPKATGTYRVRALVEQGRNTSDRLVAKRFQVR